MQRVTLTYPTWTMVNVPENIAGLAAKRTEHLLALAGRRTLIELLRDAYVQGLHDVANLKDNSHSGSPRARLAEYRALEQSNDR